MYGFTTTIFLVGVPRTLVFVFAINSPPHLIYYRPLQ
nr:MAG TPA: hypothetical protein [Caudoviricetes sp.]DAZ23140.1 MAG TPA: hypothetical protein [Caudoviricetes sp.]